MPVTDARYYKTLLVCPNRAMAAELSPFVASGLPLAPVHDLNAVPTRKQVVDLLKSFEPRLCLVDFASDADRAFAFLADIASLDPNIPVVALLAGNNPDLILRCLRQGAAEFLIRPFTNEQIEAAFEKIARLHPAPANRRSAESHAIAVVPAKGACGATTIACNLAHHAKKRNAGKTLLADLDPLTGTVSFLLKLKSTYSFLDVLARHDTLDPDLWKQLVINNQGVDVLLPPDHLIEGMDDLPEATSMVQSAHDIYDTVVVDCGSAFGRWNLSIAAAADKIVLVTTNELTCLQATQRVLSYYQLSKIDPSKINIVVNRYHADLGLQSEWLNEALDNEVLHLVPSDYDTLQRATMEGKPAAANTTFGKSMSTLMQLLVGAEKRAEKSPGKGGLFSKFSRN